MVEASQKLDILEKFLGEYHYSESQQEAVFFCYFCKHHKKKLSVNLETGKFHCWVCGKKGRSLRPLLKKFCSESEIKNIHKLFKGLEQTEQDFASFVLKLPEDFMPLAAIKETRFGESLYRYLAHRGASVEDVLKFKLGTSMKDEEFKNRIIFPSFDANGYLNFYLARSVNENVRPKYVNADIPKGYKNKIIINELNLNFQAPLTIVEGFFDLFKTNKNATFLAGNDLSMNSSLFQQISTNKTPVYLALDADAKEQQDRLATKFYAHGVPVYLIDVSPYKDVGEMTREEFLTRHKNAKEYTERDSFLFRAHKALWQ